MTQTQYYALDDANQKNSIDPALSLAQDYTVRCIIVIGRHRKTEHHYYCSERACQKRSEATFSGALKFFRIGYQSKKRILITRANSSIKPVEFIVTEIYISLCTHAYKSLVLHVCRKKR
jgi:hypothetical protein